MKKTKISKQASASESILQDAAINYMISLPAFKKELDGLAEKIREAAFNAANEATMATNFEIKVYGFIQKHLHFEFSPVKEEAIATKRHVKKGRIDSRIGALVLEYKHKPKMESVKEQNEAVNQLKNYIESLPECHKHGAVGVLTDGWRIKFISIEEDDGFSETSFEDLNGDHLLRIIRGILLLDKKALTPKNLIDGFCSGNPSVANELSRALHNALTKPTGRTKMLLKEWQAIFKLAHDDQSKQTAIEERKKALAEALDITIAQNDNDTEYRALYAIQTAYAIIVKAIAYKVLTTIRFNKSQISFKDLAEGSTDELRTCLERLESGAIFRQEGFGNLLEGDFFAWYCTKSQWDEPLSKAVRKVFATLTEYENHHMFDGQSRIQDLFKDLYMAIIPDKVRHSLGEFYTPPWLAEHLVFESLSTIDHSKPWSSLDPCCGSGTFITVLIRIVLDEVKELPADQKLKQVLERVKAIDLNPLAVLTTRINYFINISPLIAHGDSFEIPVYLGDSSYVPKPETIGSVKCLTYQIETEKGPLKVVLPTSAVSDVKRFSATMTLLETHIENEDETSVSDALATIVAPTDLTPEVKTEIDALARRLVRLQKNKWNGIWARIISNFLTTANLGKFDIIVGNPPWIDWKNLPQGYRERIKGLCIDRKLFSGDSVTGGINLNVCALISNVAAENWLKPDGVLGFLMPENLIFQQSYEGFRNFYLTANQRLYFQKLIDWTKSGHPFAPVQHRFLTYIIGAKVQNYTKGISVDKYEKLPNSKKDNILPLGNYSNTLSFAGVEHLFKKKHVLAVMASARNTSFSYAIDKKQAKSFSKIAGECTYPGREGVEVFPQELFLLTVDTSKKSKNGLVYVENFQNTRSKHKIAKGTFLLEKEFLYPLVKGVDIERFHVELSSFVVPFPYEKMSRSAIPRTTLAKAAPNLMGYFNSNKSHFEAQTNYNDKIMGEKNANEFYALARVGEYSYGNHFVCFRDNTKWQAAVISTINTPWGEAKRPIFQNHAVSISQRKNGSFITLDEAHYICAIFNAPIVATYLLNSSDSRSFKIRPPIKVPAYDVANEMHQKLVCLSKQAHQSYRDIVEMKKINEALDSVYLSIL